MAKPRASNSLPRMTQGMFFIAALLHVHCNNQMTDFVNHIIIAAQLHADQSINRNKKLPANLAGKSHCDTV